MSSPRFASGRTMECEAWKRRVHAEERALRDFRPGGTLGGSQSPVSQARSRSPRKQIMASTPASLPHCGGPYTIAGVSQRMSALERAVEDGELTRAAVTFELKELRGVLDRLVAEGSVRGDMTPSQSTRSAGSGLPSLYHNSSSASARSGASSRRGF